MYTQRNKDRRRITRQTSFPLKTKGGRLVEKDRRCIPDRRLGNLHHENIYVDDHGLPEYLADTPIPSSGKVMK
jgi:hypothetical protein